MSAVRSSWRGLLGSKRWAPAALWCVAVAVFGPACSQTVMAPFVWIDEWKEPGNVSQGDYIIGVGDALNVLVWDQEKMSARVRVRSDGRVSLPFLDDVPVAGMTPVALARSLEGKLKQFIVTPQVTVVVEEAKPLSVSVLGQVAQPGLYNLDPGAGVAQALAAAGGLKDFAHKDRVFLLRTDVKTRLRMTYDDVTAGKGTASTLRLRTGDVVIVE